MVIELKSPIITEKTENQNYDINYGVLKKGANTEVNVNFSGCNFLSFRKSCQCSQPEVTLLNDGFELTIKYDSKKIGTISQYIEITVEEENKEQKKVRFNLKGQIV